MAIKMVQNLGKHRMEMLKEILSKVWSAGNAHDDWRKVLIISIH